MGYFNSAQAIADYAEIIMHIKKKLGAFYSPVLVVGGSYGGSKYNNYPKILNLFNFDPFKLYLSVTVGNHFCCSMEMKTVLASWLRLKYPHVALGALASSAPILYSDKITPRGAYFSVVTKDFRVFITLNFRLHFSSPFNEIWKPCTGSE